MKKIISLVLSAILLLSVFTVLTYAAEPDMQFSLKGSTGKPGDTVKVEVYLDKNPGTWAALFHLCFDTKVLKLKDVQNGEVFANSEFTKAPLDNDGFYRYYGQSDALKNNTKTGLIMTAEFEVTEKAVNGYHDVWLEFPDNGEGWFFDVDNNDINRTVPADKDVKAAVTVFGSSATGEPVTDDKGLVAETDPAKETKAPVTAYVTDADNNFVTDEKGAIETYIVPSGKQEDAPQYVTDSDGNFARDDNGNLETYYVNDKGEIVEKTEVTTQGADDSKKDDSTLHKVLIIAACAAVAVAVVIIIVVITTSKRKEKKELNGIMNPTDTDSEE